MTHTVLVTFCLLLIVQCVMTTLYNTSTSCFSGSERNEQITASCHLNTTTEVGIIAVHRQFFGVKPSSNMCQSTDNASVCCSHNDADCVLVSVAGQLPDATIAGCSGQRECLIQAKKKFTGSCPQNTLFPSFTTYGHMEYECINVGLLTDMCHDGIIKNNKNLYPSSNIYHLNTEHQDRTCSCTATTACGETIDVEAVDIRLHRTASSCTENLLILDNRNTTHNNTITCYNTSLNGLVSIFTSQSNRLTLNLTISGKHTGKVWIKIKGTSPNTTVALKCGEYSQIAPDTSHLCPGDLTTTPPTTTTTTPTTTTTTTPPTTTTTQKKCGSEEVCEGTAATAAALSIGAIAGIIIAGVIILLVIILILVLIFRRSTPPDTDQNYITASYQTPDYETLRNYVPHERARVAYDNQVYLHDKMESPDANHDYEELQEKMDRGACSYDNAAVQIQPPQYDNNESVMVMPKGAVG